MIEGVEQSRGAGRQRLDKWLFYTRLAKSRGLAQKWVSDGDVSVNGRSMNQPGFLVKPGDTIELMRWDGMRRKVRTVVVILPGDRRGPYGEARTLYDDRGTAEIDT